MERKRKKSASLLVILFLGYILYVGAAGVPKFLLNTSTALNSDETTFPEYIEVINGQYETMLDDSTDIPLLKNNSTYINLNGLMAKVLNQKEVNGRVVLNNGHLSSVDNPYNPKKVEERVNNILDLYKKQVSKGGDFLFVMAPFQIYDPDALLPAGYEDYTNENANYFVEILKKNNVPVLDLREQMVEEKIDYNDAFFTTDHHWKPETGFWAYTEIIKELYNIGYIEKVDKYYIDKNNYNFKVFEDAFLGSSGKRTGKYFAGVDDITIIYPKFDTEISVKINSAKVNKTGRYEDISYRYPIDTVFEKVTNPDYFNETPYGFYGWSDRDLVNWRNDSAPENKRVLRIGDSFGNVPFSFMPLYFDSCDEMDTRHFKDSFQDYYEKYDPDIIVFLINPNSVFNALTSDVYTK